MIGRTSQVLCLRTQCGIMSLKANAHTSAGHKNVNASNIATPRSKRP
jgi:hypothetical protein